MPPFVTGCSHFRGLFSLTIHSMPIHEEHPESSLQRLGFFFNLFSFNSWWCSISSYGSSLVFCRRGSNSLLGCAESFTWSFLTFSSSDSAGIDSHSFLAMSYLKDISLKLGGIFIMDDAILNTVHDKGSRNNIEKPRFCQGLWFWLNRSCEYWCSLESNGQTWSHGCVEEKLQLKIKKKSGWKYNVQRNGKTLTSLWELMLCKLIQFSINFMQIHLHSMLQAL